MNWTKEEILEYNRRCAEFLGKIKEGYEFSLDPTYEFGKKLSSPDDTWATTSYTVSYMKFHSDWNWIMEVIEAIEKLSYLVVIQSNFCQIQEIGKKENNFKPYIIASLYDKFKKEAVVQAINQFLIWYNNEQRT